MSSVFCAVRGPVRELVADLQVREEVGSNDRLVLTAEEFEETSPVLHGMIKYSSLLL
jgi:hypothetical protein